MVQSQIENTGMDINSLEDYFLAIRICFGSLQFLISVRQRLFQRFFQQIRTVKLFNNVCS